MQKERAFATGQVRMNFAKLAKLREFLTVLSKSIRYTDHQFICESANRNSLIFKFEYGPVWGCWEDDIRKKVKSACFKVGTSPSFEVVNFKRHIVERR